MDIELIGPWLACPTGRSELRILFAFDPARHAILLVAGDKAGNWTGWYKENTHLADDLFGDHLATLGRA